MKLEFFQNEEIGPVCDIKFNLSVIGVKRTDGLEVVSSSRPKEVYNYLICTLIDLICQSLIITATERGYSRV